MSFWALLLVALGLSMDAGAVAVCAGLSWCRFSLKKACVVGLYFGFFQALMPTLGYLAALRFSARIEAFSPWVAFVLLGVIGGKMLRDGLQKEEKACEVHPALRPGKMLPLALATSVDALAAGVSFAFLRVRMAPAAALIGGATFVISVLGVKIGQAFGGRFGKRAVLGGGLVLVLMGVKILVEHFVA